MSFVRYLLIMLNAKLDQFSYFIGRNLDVFLIPKPVYDPKTLYRVFYRISSFGSRGKS